MVGPLIPAGKGQPASLPSCEISREKMKYLEVTRRKVRTLPPENGGDRKNSGCALGIAHVPGITVSVV